MKLFYSHKLLTQLGNVLLALCLLALNSGPVSVADALSTQANSTAAAITSEPPRLGVMKGTQLGGKITIFPSGSNEDGEHLRYVKQIGKMNSIGVQWSKSQMKNISAVTPVINNRILINFSPYIDGQDPNTGTVLPESQIRQRMEIIAPYSKWIRSFSCGNGLEAIGRIAHEMNLQVAVNAWIGSTDAVNQQQITCLINEANAGHVDLAIVGSEALLRRDVTPDTLIGYIDQVRQAIPLSIPVTTADVYTTFLQNPLLVGHIDLIFANIYPFWEGYDVQYGVAMLNYYYNQLVTTYPSKTIQISETGWPSCGSWGDAVGSLENEAQYFSQVETWARDKNVTLFYFDAFDESWKVPYEGVQGGCWGIWNKDGVMKEGMLSVFDGTSANAPYDLTLPFTCGSDQFSFHFTYVPPYGSYENVQGKTCGIFHKDYKIMLYIKVNGGWWVKPYWDHPTTSINSNGTWSVDYTTGGIDQLAIEIRAYLIPTNQVGSCNPISASCGYLMISLTRPTDPNAFDKSGPANGATNQSITPTLSWGSSASATSYEYCYDQTNDNVCSNWTSNGTGTTTVLNGLSPATKYFWHVRAAVNGLGTYYSNNSPEAFWSFTTDSDVSPPTVSNIARLNLNPANAHNVNFTVTFSESVTGLDTTWPFSDFALTTTGVTGAMINGVIGSGANYTVTVNTGSGNGTVRMDVVDNNTIIDRFGNKLGGINAGDGDFTSGQIYLIIKTPSFVDVPFTHWAWPFIERLYAAGITSGCGNGNYCPTTIVTRDQMAVFLLKGKHGSGYVPPAPTGVFSDVPTNYWAAAWIEQLAAEGITAGCGGGNYCPTTPVTRDQMAIFLLKAKHGSNYVPPAPTGVFNDVPTNYWAAAWIEQLAAEWITAGCGSGNYCPATPVTRDQMAVFLVKNFNLP